MLELTIHSFSYKKGIPEDNTGNGGGFLFDCRAIHNPGRYDQYKSLTGLDKPVIEFLEKDGEIRTFLEYVTPLVEMSLKRYIERNFTHLTVGFGCTGGQHRSVYCAQQLAQHLHNNYPVQIKLIHREQNISQTFEPIL